MQSKKELKRKLALHRVKLAAMRLEGAVLRFQYSLAEAADTFERFSVDIVLSDDTIEDPLEAEVID